MKVIWAIDAFEDNKELNEKIAKFITHLHKTSHVEIEPLYLLRENDVILPTYEAPAWVTDHSKTAEILFREVLQDYELPFLNEAKVLPHASQSNVGAAEALAEYALVNRVDLIIVGSHGRKGFQRFLLGSFSESLIHNSPAPVCVISAQSKKTSSTHNILFPTDLGEHSKINFEHVLSLAKKFNSEITIVHGLTRPLEGLFDFETASQVYTYEGQILSIGQIVERQKDNLQRQLEEWVRWADFVDVKAQYLIDTSFVGIDDMIIKAAIERDIDLIVMEAQSGSMSAALLGSYTRETIRKAPCPVYILPKGFYDEQRTQEAAPDQPRPMF